MSRKKYTNPFYAVVGYEHGIYADEIRKQRYKTMKEAEKKADEFREEFKNTKYIVRCGHDIIFY